MVLQNGSATAGVTVTITPAGGWTIDGNATAVIPISTSCSIYVDPVNATDWLAACAPLGVSVGGLNTKSLTDQGPCATTDAFLYWPSATAPITCDSGITTNTSGQLSATGGLVAVSDGVHAGIAALIGNTMNPVIPSNTFSWLGPSSASFTAYGLQATAANPTKNGLMYADAPASSVSPVSFSSTAPCAAVGSAASPSLVACAAAKTGQFSCATNATGATCVISTTAVTAHSLIFVQESDTAVTGTALGVTCNTGTDVLSTSRLLASSVAGTSFTINLGTVTTNPACFDYMIVN